MKRYSIFLMLPVVLAACKSTRSGNDEISEALRIHEKVITIDSHSDTPLEFMHKGFDFGEKHDPVTTHTKIDLPRMKEGGLDGLFMAVFVGQGERSDEGNKEAFREAVAVFDSINAQVSRNSRDLEIALRPDDIRKITRQGKRAVYLGLENGYPVGRDLSLVDTFFRRGARYITLCHTRNNDICDSSTDEAGPENNGVSSFGKEVIRRMNELGMMIDVSHISDKSFYDVLEISEDPVIASHSCARAICDNPRNLTDDMLRKLADNGGVIQMCILSDYVKEPEPYPERDSARESVFARHGDYYSLDEAGKEAFLKDWYRVDVDFPPNLATVSDVVDHIDHIVEVAGIDHVGIGSDFDGGGGVDGCFDVSEFPNITIELFRRGYSERDIEKIWGGNLLRVMEEVERR